MDTHYHHACCGNCPFSTPEQSVSFTCTTETTKDDTREATQDEIATLAAATARIYSIMEIFADRDFSRASIEVTHYETDITLVTVALERLLYDIEEGKVDPISLPYFAANTRVPNNG